MGSPTIAPVWFSVQRTSSLVTKLVSTLHSLPPTITRSGGGGGLLDSRRRSPEHVALMH